MTKKVLFLCLLFVLASITGISRGINQGFSELFQKTGGKILFSESFDHLPTGYLPQGWETQGPGKHNWGAIDMDNAGGEAPQMRFYIHPIFEGTSYLLTPNIDTEGSEGLILSFKNRVDNFSGLFDNDELAVEYSFDQGDQWEELWSFVVTKSRGPEELLLFTEVPASAEEVQFRFRFSGNSGNIHMWSFDDIVLRQAPQHEVHAGSVSGNPLPVAQKEHTYTLNVLNTGVEPFDDYTVKLMKGEGDEIASLPGSSVAFGESVDYEFQWVPNEQNAGKTQLWGLVEWEDDDGVSESATQPLDVFVLESYLATNFIGTDDVVSPHYIQQPFDFQANNSMSQTIYYPREMSLLGGEITHVVYFNHFDHAQEKEIKIYMGTTEKEHLFDGYISTQDHQLVFEGSLLFPGGSNPIVIALDEPFLYEGGDKNLVVTNHAPVDDWQAPPYNRFYVSETDNPHRARALRSDELVINPENPPVGGEVGSVIPNTVFVFDGQDLGSVAGLVLDENGNAFPEVKLEVESTGAVTHSLENGSFAFEICPVGEQAISVSYVGYHDQQHTLDIETGQTAELDIVMEPLPKVSLGGTVMVSDEQGAPAAGAEVVLHGNTTHETNVDENGQFLLSDVYGQQQYEMTIILEGYDDYGQTLLLGPDDSILEDIILTEKAHPAFNVKATSDEVNDEVIHISWEEAGTAIEKDFRHDSGVMDRVFGLYPSDLNTVYGSVHRHHSQLHEVSWFLGSETFVYNTVKIWIVALDEDGWPDSSNIVYSADDIPNEQRQWNTYELTDPLVMENGFLVGISVDGWMGIAMDSGEEPYPFEPLTQFVAIDISGDNAFEALENLWDNFSASNFLIRAHGLTYGSASEDQTDKGRIEADAAKDDLYFINDESFENSIKQNKSSYDSKALESYSVYRLKDGEQDLEPDEWTLLAENYQQLELEDNDWGQLEPGVWLYAVKAEYTNDVYAEPAFSNLMPKDMLVPVTIQVSANTGEDPMGASLVLTHASQGDEHQYSAVVPPGGMVEFPQLWRGVYDISIEFDGYEEYQAVDVDFTEGGDYYAELVEEIIAPHTLMIVQEELFADQVTFKWNASELIQLYQHQGHVPEQPNAYYQESSNVYGTVFDLTPYPDAVIEYMDFHHMQWGVPEGNYQYTIHLVDWDTFTILESVGPLFTNTTDDWEKGIELGSFTAEEVSHLGVFVQPQANEPLSGTFYPTITGDANGPYGLSVVAPLADLSQYAVNPYVMGDFMINLWVETSYFEQDVVKAGLATFIDGQPVKTRRGNATPASPEKFTQKSSGVLKKGAKAFEGFSIFLADMNEPVATGVMSEEYMFTNMEVGEYTAGVKGVYTTGASEVATLDFLVEEGYEVSFNITDTEGQLVDNAQITINNEEYEQGNYMFDRVLPGTYPFTVTHAMFLNYQGEMLVANDNLQLDIELKADNVSARPEVGIDAVNIYPNPASERIHLVSDTAIETIRIFDITGQLHKKQRMKSYQGDVNVEQLPAGLYLIEILTADGAYIKKIQINR